MATVNLTLLLGFSMKKGLSDKKSESSKKAGKGKNKEKNPQDEEKKSAKGKEKKAKKQKEIKQELKREESVVKPKNLFEVGNPKKFAHIEYELLPERPPFKVDVNCWGDFAKVYCEDDVRAIRIIQQNNIAWVPVKVKHFFKRLTKEELLQLQSHVIKFSIWSQADKRGQQAKSEKTNAFYIFEKNLENTSIVEAFEKPPSDERGYEDYLKEEQLDTELRLFKKCAFRGDTKSSYLAFLNYFPDEIHDHFIKKIIQDVTEGVSVICKEFVRIWNATSSENIQVGETSGDKVKGKSKDKESHGKKKGKEKKGGSGGGTLTITVSGEVFFTEPNLSVHHLIRHDREIFDGYALITVRNLLTRFQKNDMNPLVINIKKVMNLPVDILSKHGFQYIKALYNVPQVAQCITTEKPITETVYINESHVFFLEKAPESTLYEFFHSKQFIIELIGIRKIAGKTSKNSSLFGSEITDEKFSKRLQPFQCLKDQQNDKLTAVQLAVASYDISSLLQYSWCFTVDAQCTNPETTMSTKTRDPLLFTDIINAHELNLDSFKETTTVSCLTDGVLMDFGTSIAMEMYLQAPQTSLLKCHTLPSVYQRMLIITSDELLATNVLNQILLHNQRFTTPEVITANYLKSGLKVKFDKDTSDIYFATNVVENREVVTGFLLDNVSSFIFYVEGTPTGLITTLWRQVMDLPSSNATTHFNINQVFAKRLYDDFLPFGGFYTVTLQTSLKNIMSQTHIYLKGNAPLPCWEALKKFDLLLRSKMLKTMSQMNLFPSAKQLLSLDVEFGVPLRWKKTVAMEYPLANNI